MSERRLVRWLLCLVALLVTVACAKASGKAPGQAAPESAVTVATAVDPSGAREVTILAGGCFWGMEEILRKIPGVVTTEAVYAGGRAGVTYEDMHSDTSGNAEAVRLTFDPKVISYEDLLEKWFFRMHDPTTKDRQGNDVGTQYRSAIFVTSEAQRQAAKRVIARVDASGVWPSPIVTQLLDAGTYTRAEDYHQRYLEKNPSGYTCHYLRDFSL
jgi:peptide methionine sulfoxide reductase msrA/msrB